MAQIVKRNIDALLQRRREEDQCKTREEYIVDAAMRFTRSMLFVHIHLVLFGVWIA